MVCLPVSADRNLRHRITIDTCRRRRTRLQHGHPLSLDSEHPAEQSVGTRQQRTRHDAHRLGRRVNRRTCLVANLPGHEGLQHEQDDQKDQRVHDAHERLRFAAHHR